MATIFCVSTYVKLAVSWRQKKNEANAEVPKAAVPGVACWEWLQKRVSSHKTACINAQLYNKDNHQIIQSLVLKWFWS